MEQKGPLKTHRLVTVFLIGIMSSALVLGHGTKGHHQEAAASPNDQALKLKRINESYQKVIRPIFVKKCFDCHSSETSYHWYRKIPGVKQLMDSDIGEGRKHLDMTEGFPFKGHGSPSEDLEALAKTIEKDSMPPLNYRIMHWGSKPTAEEKREIWSWTEESLKILKK